MEHSYITTLQGGKYSIVRTIGHGGFGVTYEALHTLLHKRLAIKEFYVRDYCLRDAETGRVCVTTQANADLVAKLKDKFMAEAVALSEMSHPNIVNVTDVFEENGTVYYVMDYIDGCSLQRMVDDRGALLEAVAVRYVCQVAQALQYVHSKHRLHLDVKPDNIMVGSDDRAVLVDFGTSKQYDEASDKNYSTLVGMSPAYAPIEQLDGSVQNFTPATDIYALGATLYTLLSGRKPLRASLLLSDNALQQYMPDDISYGVRQAITRAMAVRVDDRTQSAQEFIDMLRAGRDTSRDAEVTANDTMLVDAVRPAKHSGARWLWPVLAVGVVAVAAVLYMIGEGSGDDVSAPVPVVPVVPVHDTVNVVRMPYHNSEGVLTGYYTGTVVDSVMTGEGEFAFVDGSLARGRFVGNQIVSGTVYYADKCRFDGTFRDERPDSGIWYDASGKRFTVLPQK